MKDLYTDTKSIEASIVCMHVSTQIYRRCLFVFEMRTHWKK